MWRAAAWLSVLALALAAHVYDSDALRAACAGAVLIALAVNSPAVLLPALALLAAAAAAIGVTAGIERVFDSVPALIAGLVAWLFARTLWRGRRPLIARAIAALDGEAELARPGAARYARVLTVIWALYQAALALLALAWALAAPAGWPSARCGAALLLPLAVAALLLLEFALRARWLPQAPKRSLFAFLRGLVQAWPALLRD